MAILSLTTLYIASMVVFGCEKVTLLKKALKSPNFQPFPFKNPYMPVILPSYLRED